MNLLIIYVLNIALDRDSSDIDPKSKRTDLEVLYKPSDYVNEQENLGNDEVIPSLPSLLVPKQADLMEEIKRISKNFNIWDMIKLFVHRPSEYKDAFVKEIEASFHSIYFGEISIIMRKFGLPPNPYFYAINSVLFSKENLDAFHLKYCFNVRSIIREILCTKSQRQLKKINEIFIEESRGGLLALVPNDRSVYKREFINQLLTVQRSTSMYFDINDSFLMDFKLYTDHNYYKKNKEKFIRIFATASYYQIRKICHEYQKRFNKTLPSSISKGRDSFLKKCAKTICEYAINSHKYYAKLLRKAASHRDMQRIIRIVTSRSEIDLTTIFREYRNMYSFQYIKSIENAFFDHIEIYTDIILPLLGLEKGTRL
ncbi:Annexin A8 [Thelohanellus kitauei]|uniref:Annexin A8 n=1 Tax=Thelohanellus kitauei TaxID=669202 RepID=A0A0C2ML61_THEKT|nr:Annexin A8 [Thelohanellus kitauei]